MKSRIKLSDPRWQSQTRQKELKKALQTSAAELLTEIKLYISESRPAGKTFRIGSIKRKASRRNSIKGLRTVDGLRIIGAKIGRRSAPGQPPAIQTGQLINSLVARRIADFKYRVGTSVIYAGILDNPRKLNRPFFHVIVEKYRPRFFANVRGAWLGK